MGQRICKGIIAENFPTLVKMLITDSKSTANPSWDKHKNKYTRHIISK